MYDSTGRNHGDTLGGNVRARGLRFSFINALPSPHLTCLFLCRSDGARWTGEKSPGAKGRSKHKFLGVVGSRARAGELSRLVLSPPDRPGRYRSTTTGMVGGGRGGGETSRGCLSRLFHLSRRRPLTQGLLISASFLHGGPPRERTLLFAWARNEIRRDRRSEQETRCSEKLIHFSMNRDESALSDFFFFFFNTYRKSSNLKNDVASSAHEKPTAVGKHCLSACAVNFTTIY